MNELIKLLTGARDWMASMGKPLPKSNAMSESERDTLYKQRLHELQLRYKSKYPKGEIPKPSIQQVVPEYYRNSKNDKSSGLF